MIRPAVPTVLAVMMCAALSAAVGSAQSAQPPVQTPPPAGAAPKPQVAPPRASATVPATARTSAVAFVTDQSGTAVPDVHVTVTGPVDREGTTGRDGTLRLQGLRAGAYRLRFQSSDFITLERDVTIKAGSLVEIDVALNREQPKPKPKPAEPESAPAPAPTAGRIPVSSDPSASAEMVALPDWIERNLIGRSDPLKESIVGKTPVTTATVVQVREPLKDRVRTDADEMLYVIAGEGILRAKGKELTLDAGALVVVPRGVVYSLERRGRNPLIALSIVGK
jgi:mannose-6-phosphate isomerase-like protein (cupin superfamily)